MASARIRFRGAVLQGLGRNCPGQVGGSDPVQQRSGHAVRGQHPDPLALQLLTEGWPHLQGQHHRTILQLAQNLRQAPRIVTGLADCRIQAALAQEGGAGRGRFEDEEALRRAQEAIRGFRHPGRGLLIGSGWDKLLAQDKGFDFLSASAPSPYRLVLTTGYLGFRGGLRLIEDIYDRVLATYK